MRSLVSALVLMSAAVAARGRAEAADWNQFRGPTGDGKATSSGLPVEWSESKNVVWKTAVPGKAWSSPVVWGDQVWMTNATEDGKRLSAVAVDARDGKIVHDITVFDVDKPQYCHPYNSYASCTPVVEEGKVWVHFGSAGTACLDTHTGKTLWARQDLPCDHHRGPGSSPIIHGDLLFLTFDGFDQQYVAALDKETGKTVWKKDRTIDYKTDNGDVKKAYSTPSVFNVGGKLQLVSPASVGSIAYDPATGDEIWKVYHGGFNAAARPLYGHGMVFVNLEGGDRLVAVRPDGTGDVTKTHVAWKFGKSTPSRPSQLLIGDHFYMVSDNGIVTCLDVKTGAPTWTERMGGRHCASLICAPGAEGSRERIYLIDEDGLSHVIEANPEEYALLSENKLDGGCMASPAVIGDALLVRTKTHLYRIENRP